MSIGCQRASARLATVLASVSCLAAGCKAERRTGETEPISDAAVAPSERASGSSTPRPPLSPRPLPRA
jgi:hypothetical protein